MTSTASQQRHAGPSCLPSPPTPPSSSSSPPPSPLGWAEELCSHATEVSRPCKRPRHHAKQSCTDESSVAHSAGNDASEASSAPNSSRTRKRTMSCYAAESLRCPPSPSCSTSPCASSASCSALEGTSQRRTLGKRHRSSRAPAPNPRSDHTAPNPLRPPSNAWQRYLQLQVPSLCDDEESEDERCAQPPVSVPVQPPPKYIELILLLA